MPEIKVEHAISFSSEDKTYPASNLVHVENFKKWNCQVGDKQAFVCMQLVKASQIHEIHIGNDGSAFVEVLVGRSGNADQDYQVILVASSFMSPMEGRTGQNLNRVRRFGPDKLTKATQSEKWDRIKVVCTQPFNKSAKYGLSFIKFYSPPSEETTKDDVSSAHKLGAFKLKEEDTDDITAGSLFARRGEKSASFTGAAAIRAAAKQVDEEPMPSREADSKGKGKRKNEESPKNSSMAKIVKISEKQQSFMSGEPKATKESQKGKKATPEKQTSIKEKETPQKQKSIKEKETPQNQKSIKEKETPQRQKSIKEKETPSTSGLEKTAPKKQASKNTPSRNDNSASVKKATKKTTTTDFKSLMKGVVFVLSGFQNPLRGDLRDQALEMGATYRGDWDDKCTHLVCAFENTPKYNQVKGKGRIVKKDWLTDSYKKKIQLPWRKYRLGRASSPADASEESTDEEAAPVEPKKPKLSSSKYDSDTETEEAESDSNIDDKEQIEPTPPVVTQSSQLTAKTASSQLSIDNSVYDKSTDEEDNADSEFTELPDFFPNKYFYFYGEFDSEEQRQLLRLVVAYGGEVEQYMNSKVNYVVSNSEWDSNFDQAVSENDRLLFVKPEWLTACHSEQKFVPPQKFLIIPD